MCVHCSTFNKEKRKQKFNTVHFEDLLLCFISLPIEDEACLKTI